MLMNPWMRVAAWSPWSEMQRLQSEVSHMFGDLARAGDRELPPINVWTGENGLKLQAELPGYASGDIEVTVVGDTLTLKGSRKGPELGANDTFHRRERSTGTFVRTLQLPFGVEEDDVKASMKNGVLEIDLPRAKRERPRKITVGARS